jgi:GPH family glycoside/pentoside/hexuronide:cation symporter
VSFAEPRYRRERTRIGKVSLSTKVYQGVGALPEALKTFGFSTFLLFYYNQILGLRAFEASLAIAVALIIDAACDPLIGSFSDGLKTRLGRRHLLMYASALPIAVGLYLVFSPPPGLSEGPLLAWLFVTVVITNVSMSLFVVPWTALYAEFSDDYAERTAIVTWRYAIGWVGAIVFVFSIWSTIFASTPAYSPGQLNPLAYGHFAPVIALTVAGAVLTTTLLTQGEIPFLLQPVSETPRFSVTAVWRDVASTFGNRDFIILFVSALITAGITGTTDTLGTYTVTFFWGLGPEQLRWFQVSILGALLAFLTLGRIEALFDKKPVIRGSFALLLIDGIVVTGLRLLDLMPPNGSNLLLGILIVNEIVRIYLTTLVGIMFVSMLADTIDLQELATGRRQEGVFAAALAFSGKATAGVGALVGGFLLQHVVLWPAHADPRTVDVHSVMRLGLVAGVLVPCLLIAPLILAGAYRVTRERHALTRQELDRRRAVAHSPPPDEAHLALEMAVNPVGGPPVR